MSMVATFCCGKDRMLAWILWAGWKAQSAYSWYEFLRFLGRGHRAAGQRRGEQEYRAHQRQRGGNCRGLLHTARRGEGSVLHGVLRVWNEGKGRVLGRSGSPASSRAGFRSIMVSVAVLWWASRLPQGPGDGGGAQGQEPQSFLQLSYVSPLPHFSVS